MDNNIRLREGMGVNNPTAQEQKAILEIAKMKNLKVFPNTILKLNAGIANSAVYSDGYIQASGLLKESISINTFIQAILNEPEKPKEVKVKLNEEYSAIVEKDCIKVGCQTFPLSIIDSLSFAKKEVEQ